MRIEWRNLNGRRLRPNNARYPDARKLDSPHNRWGEACRKSCPSTGRNAILKWIQKIRFGRLLIDTEVYPFAERERISLEAVRKTRLGKSRSDGMGETIYENAIRGNGTGRSGTDKWKNRKIRDNAEKKQGLARTQYRDLGNAEDVPAGGRGYEYDLRKAKRREQQKMKDMAREERSDG